MDEANSTLTRRLISGTPKSLAFAELVWAHEQNSSQWFRESGEIWHKSLSEFLTFWAQCDEIHGLFSGDVLIACVYLEYIGLKQLNIHVSVIHPKACGPQRQALVDFFVDLRNQKAAEGFSIQIGWLLEQNWPMIRLVEKAGFLKTGLTMTHGAMRGRPSVWHQVRAAI